jgi:hypothetical protein
MTTWLLRLMRKASRVALLGLVFTALAVRASLPLAAQAPAAQSQATPAGWVFTPAISVASTWDNNVLLATEGSETVGDYLTAISPRAALSFRGRRTTFQLDYRGAYQLYQQLSELNAFDQRANLSFRQRFTPRVSLFARNSLSRSPTTDELDLPGVVFRREGVLIDDLRSGLEARLNERTTLSGAYTFQWLKFDQIDAPPPFDVVDRSGHAHGAVFEFDHVVNSRLTVGAEYEMRHAIVDQARDFDVQNALGTVEYRLNERLALSGAAGYAWLDTARLNGQQSAPTFRVNLSRSGSRMAWDVGYRRSFLPSVGFGGTFENQELHAGLLASLTRRLDWRGSLTVLEADPLAAAELGALGPIGLRSIYARSSLFYLATRYLRVEGFYVAAFQDTRRAGGKINRSRAGVQVVTSTRMRIR